jgi:hypothetical protein
MDLPEVAGEKVEKREQALKEDRQHGDPIPPFSVPSARPMYLMIRSTALDNILQSSLWQRRLLRVNDESRAAYRTALFTGAVISGRIRLPSHGVATFWLGSALKLDMHWMQLHRGEQSFSCKLMQPWLYQITMRLQSLRSQKSPNACSPFIRLNQRHSRRIGVKSQRLAAWASVGNDDRRRRMHCNEGRSGLPPSLGYGGLRVRAAANGDAVGVLHHAGTIMNWWLFQLSKRGR